MIRTDMPVRLRQVKDREVRVVVSSGQPGRDKLIVDIDGLDLANYRKNPVVLWQHLPEYPVARCSPVSRNGGTLEGICTFAPPGISETADSVYQMVKAGIVNSVSIGFEPIETDRRDKNGVSRVTRSELMELSFVSIPADTGAVVLERGARRRGRAWYLDPPGQQRFDLGSRLLELERLKPAAQRRLEAAMLRYRSLGSPLPPPPTWCGSRAATVRAIADHIVADALARSAWIGRHRSTDVVPYSLTERLREAAALRRSY